MRKKMPRDMAPQVFINDPKELESKILNRTLRQGDHFTIKDLTTTKPIEVPEGFAAFPIKATVEFAGHFVLPGSHVNVVMTEDLNGVKRAVPVLQNVLVVAVNDTPERKEGETSKPTVNNITLAVKPKDGLILALAAKRGDLRLMQRREGDDAVIKWGAIEQLPGDKDRDPAGGPGGTPGLDTVQLPVAIKDIPTGTKIENPEEYFREQAHPVPAPPNAVVALSDLKGKYVTRELVANQWVPTVAIADKEPEKPKEPEVVVKEKEPEKPVKPAPPVHTHVMIGIQGGKSETHVFKNGKLVSGSTGGATAGDPTEFPADPADKGAPDKGTPDKSGPDKGEKSGS
jgi:hypothetical protein